MFGGDYWDVEHVFGGLGVVSPLPISTANRPRTPFLLRKEQLLILPLLCELLDIGDALSHTRRRKIRLAVGSAH